MDEGRDGHAHGTFINGFHDVSNSIATSVRTRALTPTVAVLLAALFNLVGALMSASVATLFTGNSISLPTGQSGLGILLAALLESAAEKTLLCVATDLTLSTEEIRTQSISAWRSARLSIGKRPTVFLLLSQ